MGMKRAQLAAMIDHTKLGPVVLPAQVEALCREAIEHGFVSVCIPANRVALARRLLDGTAVKVCTVIGFPHGAHTSEVKACEARVAMEDGAQELDMVVDVAALKAGDHRAVLADIDAVCRVAHTGPNRACVKVILEMALLEHDEKVAGCILSAAAGADFVKTSTGFGPGGATTEDVALMRQLVGPELGVKAAGGIKTAQDAQAFIDAGATRLGASAGVAIISALPE